ncbi:hypothetical protein [Streptomyces chumphonensis]|uniref:hypothetical protein n=1 Tax=Streptomyces chumphonensis TaxID=1214925 RepID=UPI003D75EDE3
MIPAEHSPAPTRTCHACHRALHPTATAQVCDHCHQHTARRLADLPGLYAELDLALTPGRRPSAVSVRVTCSGGQLPFKPHVADCRTDARLVLTGWVRDWADVLDQQAPVWPVGHVEQVAVACEWLRWRWDRAARVHPAVDEIVGEIRRVHREVDEAARGREERPVWLVCATPECGGQLRFTVSTGSATCSGCGARYDRIALTALPVAGRATAA